MMGLGPFRPDLADTNEGVLANLLNASLKPDGSGVAYGPLPGLVVASTATALPDAPKGTLTAVTSGGVYKNFVMTTTNIYLLAADGTPTSIGSGYALPAGDKWSATQFGTKAIFTNTADGMLEYDVDAGGAVTAISGAPKARVVRVMFDVLFAGDCDGENRLLRNSDYNYANWTTGVSGYQPMPDGEEIVGMAEIVDGFAVVLQRNAIRGLQRIADASLYQMRLLAANQGAVNPWCIVPVKGAVYYIDVNGVHRVTPAGVQELSENKCSEWLLGRMGTDAMSSIEGAYGPTSETVRWRYDDGTNTTIFANALDYSMRLNEFVPVEEETTAIFTTATPGYTMEELDAFGDMDDLNGDLSLDDRFYFGGVPQLGALDEDFKLGYFSGSSLAATFETSTTALPKRTDILEVKPITDSADISVSIGTSDRLSDALVFDDAVTPDEDGICPMYSAGKNLRFRATIPAASTWTYFRGFDDLASASGGRG
jgi:hypothetical protein